MYKQTNYILSGKIRNVQKLHDPNNNIEENLEKNDMSNQTKLLSQKSNVDQVNTLGDYRELPLTSWETLALSNNRAGESISTLRL